MVKLLLENGVKIPPSTPAGPCVIHIAIENCDLSMVKLLLENGAKIPAPDPSGYSVIHAFAESRTWGREITDDLGSLLDLLLEKMPAGAESMEWHEPGVDMLQTIQCPLSLAMNSGNWDGFEMLLKHGAQLRTTQPLEWFLMRAIQEFNLERVHFLLNHGAKLGANAGGDIIDLMRPRYGINLADQWDTFVLILSEMVQHGGDINSSKNGRTSLLVATEMDDVPSAIVQTLLNGGADIYRTNNEGLDAFIVSALHENVHTLCLLLKATIKVPHSAAGGHWTQRLCSTSHDPSHDSIAYICECLKQHNLLDQHTKSSNESLLHLAVKAGSAHTVAHLIACGADVNVTDIYRWTPLHRAILRNDGPIVDLLLAVGADIHGATQEWSGYRRPTSIEEGFQWTGQPLHLASMAGDVRVVAELLELGADVQASTGSDPLRCPGHGPTALHIALDTGYFHGGRKGDALDRERLEIAVILVEKGAKVRGVADHINLDDVLRFEGFEDLWNKLRAGVTENGKIL
ncbi:ankyrin repeat-containing domain protein [Mycena olivaceomarginata]|nr:ankyrin repeat-containing domain protein [Mycena olivaceomarginata]